MKNSKPRSIMKNNKPNIIIVVSLIVLVVVLIIMGGIAKTAPTKDFKSSCEKGEIKCIIETIRYIGDDGKYTYDKYIVSGFSIKDGMIIFYPMEGEYSGKQHVIPISNIQMVRELT